ncbi:MAG: methionyl-tRNA formyltransferase [Comamonadaceae bacterium]|nr:MAG: methionyl-tRNA formyltransferase [Comamonadaceae bacterium]
MRIVFAGTPAFARTALAALDAAGFEVALVLTQPDRPAGRGLKLQPSPVKALALERGWPVAQPRSLRLDGKFPDEAAAGRDALLEAHAEAMVVAAYGLILPQWVLDLPRRGCFNIHASLLPRWRGAAPIHRAIEAGDVETGITIMQMDAGLDTGDMLLTERTPVALDGPVPDTTARLHDRLADMGGRLIVEALRLAEAGALQPRRQPEEGVTYAHKVEKHEAQVDWHHDAAAIVRRIRAFDPFPGAASSVDGAQIKLWAAQVDRSAPDAAPGTVLAVGEAGIVVAAADSVVRLTELQRPGGRRLGAAEFLRGFELRAGQMMGG